MAKGSYILVLHLEQTIADLQVGKLGHFHLLAGYYLYVGSAFGTGGLTARLSHHEQRQKTRPHWHIDYLRARTRLCEIWTVSGQLRQECRWCNALITEPNVSIPIAKFGASDTGCRSHLFYLPHPPRPSLLSRIILAGIDTEGPIELQIEVHHFENHSTEHYR